MMDHFRGRLEVFGFADLLQWMELNRRSGRLTLTHGKDRRIIDWRDGQIIYVSGSLPRHRLGVHLLRSGALPAATLYELLARNFTTQENLSRLILEGGYDTLDGLSLRVEELARRLLFEMFEWRRATFEYDPGYRVQPILRIGLTLRGQAVAFQGAKKFDDTRRKGRRDSSDDVEPPWKLTPGETEQRFWETIERVAEPLPSGEAREQFHAFTHLTDRIRDRMVGNVAMHPVHEDSAQLLLELLKKSPMKPEGVVPIAALDPYLTLDLLILANALSIDRDNSVGTVPDAIHRLGARALTVLVDRLSAPDFPRIPEGDGAALALRRASVAAAIAGGKYAERYGMERERAYTLGLLHTVCYAELFEVVRDMDFPAGPFRAAALEIYRPHVGAWRAESWGLPLDFQSTLSDDGSEPSAAAALVRVARAALPECAVGAVTPEGVEPLWAEEIASEVAMVFEFLGLGPVEKKPAHRTTTP
jgi:HD-like signal output (HDOD) protein